MKACVLSGPRREGLWKRNKMACGQTLYIAFRKLVPASTGNLHSLLHRRGHFRHIRLTAFTPPSLTFKRQLLTANAYLRRLSWPLDIGARLLELLIIFGPTLACIPLLRSLGFNLEGWQLLRYSLRLAGPAFVKLGQWAATRPDILPSSLCLVLGELHSRGTEHSMSWNRVLVLTHFGIALDEMFREFEAKPIGSGSVAQVHRARLRSTGELVAVKLTHPRIRQLVGLDLLIIDAGARLIDWLIPGAHWIGFPEQARLFAELMQRQLDLRYEAYALHRFERNFRWFRRSVGFPHAFIASADVLVETLQTGYPISCLFDLPSTSPDIIAIKRQIATLGLRSFLQMLLWDNFVHADLHPGNIMFDLSPARTSGSGPKSCTTLAEEIQQQADRGQFLSPQIVFIDCGLVAELRPVDFANFTDLFIAMVVRGDGRQAARLILERSPGDPRDFIDPDRFIDELAALIEPLFRPGRLLSLADLPIAQMLMRVFELVRRHRVRLEEHFTNLAMSLICVESLGRRLAPDINVAPLLMQAGVQYLATNVARTVTKRVQPFL